MARNKAPENVRAQLAALTVKTESEIDFSDLPESKGDAWRNASRGKFYRPVKQQLSVRIDADVIAWLKSQGDVCVIRSASGGFANRELPINPFALEYELSQSTYESHVITWLMVDANQT